MKNNSTYFLGRSIAKQFPFERIPITIKEQEQQQPEQPKQRKEIITTKLVITMVIIKIVKIAVLILWM